MKLTTQVSVRELKEIAEERSRYETRAWINAVCKYFQITEGQLTTERKKMKFAYPRQVLCYILNYERLKKIVWMGRFLHQSHSTVSTSIDKIEDLISVQDLETVSDLKNVRKVYEGKEAVKKYDHSYFDKGDYMRLKDIRTRYYDKVGRPKKKEEKPFVRPEAQYTNISGYITLKNKMEAI
jgi:hypothetical protein